MPYLPPFLRTNLTGWFRIDAFDQYVAAAPIWRDLSGLGNDLVGSVAVGFPGEFDGSVVYIGPALSVFMNSTLGTVLVAAQVDSIVSSSATVTDQDCIWCSQLKAGAYLRDNAGVRTYSAHNDDGTSDAKIVTPANGLPDAEVAIFMWMHGAALFGSVDDLLYGSAASGATSSMANAFRLGLNNAGTAGFVGQMFEILIWAGTFTEEKLSQAINYLSGNWSRRGNPMGQARSRASRRLWEFRQPPNLVMLRQAPLDLIGVDLLADVTATHPLGLRPGGIGWGEESWERGELRVMEKALSFDEMALSLSCRDLRHYRAVLALECVPVAGGNVERGDGMLILSNDLRVASISTTKSWLLGGANQVIESRSSAERLLAASDGGGQGEGAYNDGMLLESEVTNMLLRSSAVNGTTGLTLTGSGTSGRLISGTTPSEPYFDASVSPNQLSFDGGTVSAALYASWPVVAMAANEKFCLATWLDVNGENYLEFQLARSTDDFFWRASDGTWVAGSTWNAWDGATNLADFPALRKPNPTYTLGRKTTLIDFGGSAGNLTVRIGESACVTGVVKNLYHVQLQSESAVVTTPVVTTTATVRRAMSSVAITAAAPRLGVDVFVSGGSHTVLVDLVPLWAPSDVATGKEKYIISQEPVSGGNATLMYWSQSSVAWVWYTDGVSLTASHSPVTNTRLKLAFRMVCLGDAGGPARKKDIFLNGVLSATSIPTSDPAVSGYICHIGRRHGSESAAEAEHEGIDSIIRRLVVVPYAMTDAEIAAW